MELFLDMISLSAPSKSGLVILASFLTACWAAAYSRLFQVAVFSGPGRVSAPASLSVSQDGSSDSGRAHPASANSAYRSIKSEGRAIDPAYSKSPSSSVLSFW